MAIGFALLMPPNTIDLNPVLFKGFTDLFDGITVKYAEFILGASFVILGMIRIIALVINGRRPIGSPIARIIGSSLGAMIFGFFTYAFFSAYPSGLWAGSVYSVLLAFEFIVIYRATKDLKNATILHST